MSKKSKTPIFDKFEEVLRLEPTQEKGRVFFTLDAGHDFFGSVNLSFDEVLRLSDEIRNMADPCVKP